MTYIQKLLLILILTMPIALAEPSVSVYVKEWYPKAGEYVFGCQAYEFYPEAYDWNFGDGEHQYDISNDNVFHRYVENGDYSVYCSATTGDFTVDDSLQFTVSGIEEIDEKIESSDNELSEETSTSPTKKKSYNSGLGETDFRNACWPKWECTQWSECIDGVQTRLCENKWDCEEFRLPLEEQECVSVNAPPELSLGFSVKSQQPVVEKISSPHIRAEISSLEEKTANIAPTLFVDVKVSQGKKHWGFW